MLTLTAVAKETMKAKIKEMKKSPDIIARLIPSPLNKDKWKIILDKREVNDHVFKSEDGKPILLVGFDLVPGLKEMIIDFRKTKQGKRFVIYKIRSKTL